MQIPRKEESWMDVFIVFYYIFAFKLMFNALWKYFLHLVFKN
jgi:hypothetical protein